MSDIFGVPWAVAPGLLHELARVYESCPSARTSAAFASSFMPPDTRYELRNGVAVIEVDGFLSKELGPLSWLLGGTSMRAVASTLQAALANPAVKSILVRVSSSGGSIKGAQTLAAAVRKAAISKPVAAIADGTALGVAYWVASAASKVYAAEPASMVGSIAVSIAHTDNSKAQAAAGLRITEITAGKYKRITSENAPLSAEGRAVLQSDVDYFYTLFVEDVARYRGVSVDRVLRQMADGQVFLAGEAKRRGLIDGVMSTERLIAEMAAGRIQKVAQSGRTTTSAPTRRLAFSP